MAVLVFVKPEVRTIQSEAESNDLVDPGVRIHFLILLPMYVGMYAHL